MAEERSREEPEEVSALPRKAPRRPRTAYAFFVKRNFHQLAADCASSNPKEIMRRLGEMWREWPEALKRPYRELHEEDRKRYAKEKLEWCQAFGGRPPKMRQRKRDFDAPTRTRNSFILFEQSVWKEVRDQFPLMTQKETVQEIAKRWRAMTTEEKKPYKERAMEDKKRYAKEKQVYLQRRSEMSGAQRMMVLNDHYENLRRENIQFVPERRYIYEPVQVQAPAPAAPEPAPPQPVAAAYPVEPVQPQAQANAAAAPVPAEVPVPAPEVDPAHQPAAPANPAPAGQQIGGG